VTGQSAAQRASASRAIARLDAGGVVFHKPKGDPYAKWCNRGAIRHVAPMPRRAGIDLDFNPNRSRTPRVHHQLRPTRRDAWYDPRGRITDSDYSRDLTDAEMNRLRVRAFGHRWANLTAKQAAEECDRAPGDSLIPMFEAKFTSPLYLDPQWWFDQFVDGWAPGLQPVIATLPGTNGGRTGLRKLAAAHEVGLPTVWLWRGASPITRTKGFRDAVDLVKSRPGRGIYRA